MSQKHGVSSTANGDKNAVLLRMTEPLLLNVGQKTLQEVHYSNILLKISLYSALPSNIVYFCPIVKNLWLVISTILLSLGVVHAQEKLFLQSSSHSRLNTETGMMINYVPVYLHKGSTLRADSGFIYS